MPVTYPSLGTGYWHWFKCRRPLLLHTSYSEILIAYELVERMSLGASLSTTTFWLNDLTMR